MLIALIFLSVVNITLAVICIKMAKKIFDLVDNGLYSRDAGGNRRPLGKQGFLRDM